MEPSHVHPRALVLRLEPPGGTLLVPDLLDVQLELGGHHRVVQDLVVGVGHRLPVVDLVHLQQDAGLPVTVPGQEENFIANLILYLLNFVREYEDIFFIHFGSFEFCM